MQWVWHARGKAREGPHAPTYLASHKPHAVLIGIRNNDVLVGGRRNSVGSGGHLGYDVLDELPCATPHTQPIVAIVGDDDVAARVHAHSIGVVHFLSGHAEGEPKLASGVEHLHAVVREVGDDGVVMQVHAQTHGTAELSVFFFLVPKGSHEAALPVEYHHAIVLVIGDTDVAAGVHAHSLGISELSVAAPFGSEGGDELPGLAPHRHPAAQALGNDYPTFLRCREASRPTELMPGLRRAKLGD